MGSVVDRMFLRPRKRTARARVLCFPYAGGTASAWNGLARALPDDIDLCSFEPPGRQNRAAEPFATSVQELVAPLFDAWDSIGDRPTVLVGYSLGSWVAFELTRQLRDAGRRLPVALLLAAARAPHEPRGAALSTLDDEAFIAELRAMNGTPREVLEDADLMEYVLPRIRADFALAERYLPAIAPPLPVPFSVLGGAHDRRTRPVHLQAWRTCCAAEFELSLLAGDHFFLHGHERAFSSRIERSLAHVARLEELR